MAQHLAELKLMVTVQNCERFFLSKVQIVIQLETWIGKELTLINETSWPRDLAITDYEDQVYVCDK